jgi:stage V sporulation protein G
MENKISNVQIIPIRPKEGLIGFASLIADEKIYLSSIGIYTKLKDSGYRITFPTKKVGQRNIYLHHPIDKNLSKAIEEAILEKACKLFLGVGCNCD